MILMLFFGAELGVNFTADLISAIFNHTVVNVLPQCAI